MMNERPNQAEEAVSIQELNKEIRILKRKLTLAETNLKRAQLVSNAQERADAVLSTALKKELQFFKLVLENSTNILLLLDFDGRFAYASRTFFLQSGIPNLWMINGRHYCEVLQPILSAGNLEQFADGVEGAVCSKTTVRYEDEIDFNGKGEPCTFDIFITPMTDEESGKSTGIMALFSDITEINNAMEAAKRANLAKSDFLANMSHEIRTPLNAIIGMSAIAKDSSDIYKIHYCLDKINDSSNHLLGIINDILDMSKIEASHFELSFSEFVFEKMLLRTVDVMRFKMEEKGITFQLQVDPTIPYAIYSDEQRLAQVIMNLLSNAIKFTPPSGNIRLAVQVESMEEEDCVLRFIVKDSGIGISEEQKPRLFKAFSQADSSISRKFGGTGLGLAISKSIINMLGGEIWLESQEYVGTTFTYNIKTTVRRHHPDAVGHYSDTALLVIDPSPEVCRSISHYAQKLEVACTTIGSPEEAVALLEQHPHNLVFFDWDSVPEGRRDIISHLRDAGCNPLLVAMIPTADWSGIETEAKSIGVCEFASKPILLPVIERILEKYHKSDRINMKEEVDDFSGKTILLVDDVEINRIIVDSLLEYTCIRIIHAENGVEAVDIFSKSPDLFDLIFMDIQMPEMDGYQATGCIRSLEGDTTAPVPIIAMTANVFREDIRRCLDTGMNDHIGKPVSRQEIVEKIRKWTGHAE